MLTSRIQPRLQRRHQQSRYRHLTTTQKKHNQYAVIDQQSYLSFAGNDYLSLSQHPKVIRAFQQAVNQFGVGASGSNVVSGHTYLHQQLSEQIADWLGCENVLLFPSGYHANIGALPALIHRHDSVALDRQAHASLIDAVLLSRARIYRYRLNQLENLLQTCPEQQQWIISDGVISTTGQLSPLPKLVQTAKNYPAKIIIDDAHGIGVLGKNGCGTLSHFQINIHETALLTASFSKAFGTSGAFIAGDNAIIDYIRQFARSYIYSNALSAATAAATLESLKQMQLESWRNDYLQELIAYFNQCAKQTDLPINTTVTPIQTFHIGNSQRSELLQKKLMQAGIYVTLMRPPSVPINQDLLRISLTIKHTKLDIDYLINTLQLLHSQ